MHVCKRCHDFLIWDRELEKYICTLCLEEYTREEAELECCSDILADTVWPLL